MPKAKKSAGTAVAERKEKLPVSSALLDQMAQEAGHGQENVGREDVALPFILLLQSLSPQLSKRDPSYNEDAEAGMFFNTLTGELFDPEEGLRIIPVFFNKVFNEWVPRNSGGGFRGSYPDLETAMNHVEEGNDITETAQHFVLVETSNGDWTEALFPMTSTKLKSSRKLNSLVTMKKMEGPQGRFTPPRYAFVYRIKAVETENEKGRFYVPVVEDDVVVQDADLYAQARGFYEVCRTGEATVDYSKMEPTFEEEDDDDEPAF